MKTKEDFMKEALSIARKYEGLTSPNPSVGAVIVKNGRVLSRGYHSGPGTLHAEAMAVKRAGSSAKGSELYVTLEPCNHYGRTPPCTTLILQAGIRKVIYGTKDENPNVTGGGARFLASRGVLVERCDPDGEVERFYRPYRVFLTERRPYVVLKMALTLNARVSLKKGAKTVFSSPEALTFVHRLRKKCDAVLVGAGTVLVDDPLLTIRYVKKPVSKRLLRVVLDGRLRLPLSSKVFATAGGDYPVLLYTFSDKKRKIKCLERMSVEVVKFQGASPSGMLDLKQVLSDLASRGIMKLLVEGGPVTASHFLKSGYVDELTCLFSPLIAPSGAPEAFISYGKSPVKKWRIKGVKKLGDTIAVFMEA